MRRASRTTRGQSTAEYAILIAVVIAAFLGIQILIKNAIQGGVMDRARQIGSRFSPSDTISTVTTTTTAHRREETLPTGETISTSLSDEVTRITVSAEVTEDVRGALFK
ncbi:MAG: hypothetical protein HY597_04425 [Candidatus Omnitrophica bacterium]|nr:hypothetical protein [Candidatus Omnitrophota bacterium]